MPDDLKDKMAAEKPRGEASLRGHLKNPDGTDKEKDRRQGEGRQEAKEKEEVSGSSSYVAKEPEKDTQLQYALYFLRGTAKGPAAANSARAPSTTPAPAPRRSRQHKVPVPAGRRQEADAELMRRRHSTLILEGRPDRRPFLLELRHHQRPQAGAQMA